MRRSKPLRQAVGVSLFPFLAVLICTMGALIVLLVLVVQQARVQAEVSQAQRPVEEIPVEESAEPAPAPPSSADVLTPEERETQEMERQRFLWRADVLEKQRAEQLGMLTEKRKELSHLETHIRDLETRWQRLEAQAQQLQALQENGQQDVAQVRAALEQTRAEAAAAARALDTAKAQRAAEANSYAIIPYRGPNGTFRQPIYVECTSQGARIHPAGVLITPHDLQGPLGPGNPLDAALRAIREYWLQVGILDPQKEPYPLLVVRPDGVMMYARCRLALRDWDDEFGYELVSAEVPLEYPPADAQMARSVAAAIDDARLRQQMLARAMPRMFRDRAGGGGYDGNFAQGRFVGGAGSARSGGGRAASSGSSGARSARTQAERTSSVTGSSAIGDSAMGGSDSQFAQASLTRGRAPAAGAHANSTTGAQPADGSLAGGSPGGMAGGSGSPGAAGSAGTAGGGAAGAVQAASNLAGGGTSVQNLAQLRGANWGLKGKPRGATGWTRPISVVCEPHRILLPPEKGDSQPPVVVAMKGPTGDAVDPLVEAVQQRVELWGVAAAGGYWKPVLNVSVAPGAEARFQDLQILLYRSGLELRRKSP